MFKNFKLGLLSENEYKTYKNRLVYLLRTAKSRYYTNIFTSYRSNTKKLWNTINNLTKSKNKKPKINNLVINDKSIGSPAQIAEAFNNFFVNAAPELEKKLPKTVNDPLEYMKARNPNNMTSPHANVADVISAIKDIKNKKCGVNDFSPHIIKLNSHLIAIPIAQLFNQSIRLGKFPLRLKCASVIPLYKKGPRNDLNNYRPISLLNIFSKIFEKIMKKYLVEFIKVNNILSPSQYGFQAKKSTEDAHRLLSKKIYEELDRSSSVLSVFIDFSKAFDTVPHDILLKKLDHYGIRGGVKNWFADYLQNRQQVTIYENAISTTKNTTLGVPQGSVLGPVLFLLYINDLPNISNTLFTILFADDATLSICGKNPIELIEITNTELLKLNVWCIANRLSINTLKTYFILFSNRPPEVLPPLVIKSNFTYDPIQRVDSIKFLGIYYDYNMSFKTHITHLSQRLSRTASLLYRVSSLMPPFVLKAMYHAHVSSLLNYCNLIWANTYPTHLQPLIKMQKRIIRIITNSDYFAHTEPLFAETRILNIENLRKYSLIVYFYRNIDSLLPRLQGQHEHQTRYRDRPRPEIHHRSIYERSYMYQLPTAWNQLLDKFPILLTKNYSLETFKKHLKQFLISNP